MPVPVHVISGAAAASSAAAARRRREQERARCSTVVKDFDAQLSTVHQKQDYAHCVQIIYPPQSAEAGAGFAIALGIVILFVGLMIFAGRR